MKEVLLIDFSPILYGNVYSVTNAVKEELKKVNGKYPFKKYRNIVIGEILEEIAYAQFQLSGKGCGKVDEVVIAVDNRDTYWRKEVWAGYKAKRQNQRDESEIEWNEVFAMQKYLFKIIEKVSNWKIINVERAEGDDVIFVLSKHLSKKDNIKRIIIHSSDHDLIQARLFSDKVHYWRTTRTVDIRLSAYQDSTKEEIYEMIREHIISGDPIDGFGHIKQFSRFSDDFLEMYPQYKGKEWQAYKNRYEIQKRFFEKTGKNAYKHPRFGYKSWKKKKQPLQEILKENPIYRENFKMNCKLALPKHIPSDLKKEIIERYETTSTNKKDKKFLWKLARQLKTYSLIASSWRF